jgi:hypothetical protein
VVALARKGAQGTWLRHDLRDCKARVNLSIQGYFKWGFAARVTCEIVERE